MCASVHADFCRPTGLESALAPTHYGTTEVAINYQCMEKLSIEYIECIHIGTLLTLALSHWATTHPY